MGWQNEVLGRRMCRQKTVAIGRWFLLLFLLSSVQACSSFENPKVRTILPASKAAWIEILPDGRILYGRGLLDVTTGEDTPFPDELGAALLDDELLYGYGEKDVTGVRHHYIIDFRPMIVVWLESLPDSPVDLPAYIREADDIYVVVTDSVKKTYRLLLLQHDSAGNVSGGHYADGVRNLDLLLGDIPYKTPPPLPRCALDQKVPSPDGQYYYDLHTELRIFSQQGELLNSIAGGDLWCYGWAGDSSGVYIQEQRGDLFSHYVGPLELLLAEP
jgi:hypothetical protein